jgi:hypothetical protein
VKEYDEGMRENYGGLDGAVSINKKRMDNLVNLL